MFIGKERDAETGLDYFGATKSPVAPAHSAREAII
jgi:hypothetical protein